VKLTFSQHERMISRKGRKVRKEEIILNSFFVLCELSGETDLFSMI